MSIQNKFFTPNLKNNIENNISSLTDPAQVRKMPSLTFLPTDMRGIIACPIRAEPPLSHVDWIKDDKPLDLGMVSNFCFSHYPYKKTF